MCALSSLEGCCLPDRLWDNWDKSQKCTIFSQRAKRLGLSSDGGLYTALSHTHPLPMSSGPPLLVPNMHPHVCARAQTRHKFNSGAVAVWEVVALVHRGRWREARQAPCPGQGGRWWLGNETRPSAEQP